MSFEEYLRDKKIDAAEFRKHEPELFGVWDKLFIKLSPASFTSQKLYLINSVRRKYTLRETATSVKKEVTAARPVFKPKIK